MTKTVEAAAEEVAVMSKWTMVWAEEGINELLADGFSIEEAQILLMNASDSVGLSVSYDRLRSVFQEIASVVKPAGRVSGPSQG